MKIAFITTFYDENGGAEYITKYIEKVSNQWCDSKVFSIMPSNQAFSSSTTHPINFILTLHDLIYEVRKYNPDKVYLHLGHSIVIIISSIFTSLGYETLLHIQDPWFSFKELKLKIEMYLDNEFLKLRNSKELPDFFKSFRKLTPLEELITMDLYSETLSKVSKKFIVSSKDMKQFLAIDYKIEKSRITVLPLFLTDEFRSKFNSVVPEVNSKDKNTLVYIGRIKDSWKNFSQILKNVQDSNWNLTIFTRDNQPEEFVKLMIDKLIKMKNRKSLLKRIEIFNNLNDKELEKQLERYIYIVVPSIVEGFSLTILENLYRGKIVLNSSVMGGPLDLIEDNANGFRFIPNDVDSFHQVLTRVDNLTGEELSSISARARESVENYTEENFNKKLKDLILAK